MREFTIDSGFRYDYPRILLRDLARSSPDGVRYLVLYDVACQFLLSLQKRQESDLLDKNKFLGYLVGRFHIFGHLKKCQVG